MADDFSTYQAGLDTPAEHAFTISGDDTATLAHTTRLLQVGVAGDVSCTFKGGETVKLKALPVGIHKLRLTQVKSTGTTATDLVGLY